MNSLIEEHKIGINTKIIPDKQSSEEKYKYNYMFDINYETLSPIIKDFQMISQLIKLVKTNQISDLIFINGNNSYSIESRFYFNYRYLIDFYLKVIDFIENDYITRVKYYIYKTGPISKNFYIILSLYKNNETSSKLEIEIILLRDKEIIPRILHAIYNEFDYNCLYLSQSIKSGKQNSFFFNSSIIKSEFCILSQIIQNTKLFEYIINGSFTKINLDEKIEEAKTSENNNSYININKNKFIHVNDIYKINLNKKKEIKNWLYVNNISFKINMLKVRENKMTIQIKLLMNNKEIETNESNPNYIFMTLELRKITDDSTFILHKCFLDFPLPNFVVNSIKKFMKKYIERIKKLIEIAKEKFDY
jgi:hypothetical protein